MSVTIGSARSSYGNTAPGDQHNGKEVSTESYYVHSLGWRVFRARDVTQQEKIAKAMEMACANNDIGYSQGTRNTLRENIKDSGFDPSKTTKKVNCDCSALARVCCNYAGIMVGDFYTATEPSKLLATGQFIELTGDKYTKQSAYLRRGDILCTCTRGHTVVVLSNGSKATSDVGTASATFTLGDRVLQNGCSGNDVKQLQTMLIALGYDCGSYGCDGDFGDCTEIAVTSFQKAHGLTENGIVNDETLQKLYSASGNDEQSSGNYVRIYGGNCYIRAEANTSATKLGLARNGETYAYAGQTSQAGWNSIKLSDESTGWVSGKYSRREG